MRTPTQEQAYQAGWRDLKPIYGACNCYQTIMESNVARIKAAVCFLAHEVFKRVERASDRAQYMDGALDRAESIVRGDEKEMSDLLLIFLLLRQMPWETLEPADLDQRFIFELERGSIELTIIEPHQANPLLASVCKRDAPAQLAWREKCDHKAYPIAL